MNKMKKRIISFSLLLLMVLGITSCKGKQEEKQYLKEVDNLIQAIAAVWLVVMSISVPAVVERVIDGF